jgi:hypothetical protein
MLTFYSVYPTACLATFGNFAIDGIAGKDAAVDNSRGTSNDPETGHFK